jgi:hypothetical protein
MNNTPMRTFNREVVTINRELEKLETHAGPITGYDLTAQWNTARANFFQLLTKLRSFALDMDIYERVASTLDDLQQRGEQLPYVPDIRDVIRAQNMLALSPHIVVTEDVRLDEQEPLELKRITVVKSDGTVLFDQDFLPQHAQKGSLPLWDAPTKHPVQAPLSVPLTQIWDDLTKALSGHYILAYNLTLVQVQLDVTAERFQLPPLVLIGDSIVDVYFDYWGKKALPTPENPEDAQLIVAAIYDHLGAPFSREAPYTTLERTTRIRQILQGIADCTLTPPSPFNTPG